MIYSERNESEVDQSYNLCFMVKDKVDEMFIKENMFQWGYKILGSNYNLVEHRFDGNDLKA